MKKLLIISLCIFLSCSADQGIEKSISLKSEICTPTIQASKLGIISYTASQLTLKVKPGNGQYRLVEKIPFVLLHQLNIPTDGVTYPVGSLKQGGTHGCTIAANSADSIFTFSEYVYYPGCWVFKIFDYNVCDEEEYYNKSSILRIEPDNATWNGNHLTLHWVPETINNDSVYVVVELNRERQEGWTTSGTGQFTKAFSEEVNPGDSVACWVYATRNGIDSDLLFFPPSVLE